MPVAVVTDSTAYLPAAATTTATSVVPLAVVPLAVMIDGVAGAEGEDVSPTEVAAALAERRVSVSTSRPSPERFAQTYRSLLAAGAEAVVSVHLSAQLSGTYEAAVAAADEVDPGRIMAVDSGSTGMGLGFCALAAVQAAQSGADLRQVAAAARSAAAATSTFFYVDTLEFLRRGGRISAASALLGTALSVKPILHVRDGAIAARDKVRTASRALERLVELAVTAAEGGPVDIAVHHLAASERARGVRDALVSRLGDQVRQLWTSEVGAVVAAHAGPGLVGVVVHRLNTTSGA